MLTNLAFEGIDYRCVVDLICKIIKAWIIRLDLFVVIGSLLYCN